jgi:hypothetical protein
MLRKWLALLSVAGIAALLLAQTYPGSISPQTIAVNQFPFNAVCDGVTNDAAAIQNAMNSVSSSGGTVLFPSGRICKVNTSLSIGNGSSSAASTNNGMVLDCASNPLSTSFFGGMSGTGGCRILWGGSGSTGVINVFGPYQGLSIRNLFIDCNLVATSVGLNTISLQGAEIRNNVFNNCQDSIELATVPQGGIFGDSNAETNHFENNIISMPNIANATGILLTGEVTDTTSVSFANIFTNTKILLPLVNTTMIGIQVQRADSNQFYNTIVFGGGTGCTAVLFDYSSVNTFPVSNVFFGIDPGPNHCMGSFANLGTPTAGDKPNYVYGLIETNGATCPNIANLSCFESNKMVMSPGGNTSNVQYLPIPSTIAGLPVCNAAAKGSTAFVSDTVGSAAPTFHLIVAGAGATTVNSLVSCNGTNWVYD